MVLDVKDVSNLSSKRTVIKMKHAIVRWNKSGLPQTFFFKFYQLIYVSNTNINNCTHKKKFISIKYTDIVKWYQHIFV